MLKLSRKQLFAVAAVLDIAYNGGGDPVQSREITHRQNIPKRYLEPVLRELVHDGILLGQRGPRGGYRLARERRRITVGEVTRIVSRLETASDPLADAALSDLGRKVVQPLWRDIQETILTKLDAVTFEDLCRDARTASVASAAREKLDYSI